MSAAVAIAFANQDVALNTKTTLTNLGIAETEGGTPIVKYQIKSGDTLASIATSFAGNTGIVAQNASNDDIFQLNAVVNYPASTYTTQSGDTLDFVAAYYLVRNLESASGRDIRGRIECRGRRWALGLCRRRRRRRWRGSFVVCQCGTLGCARLHLGSNGCWRGRKRIAHTHPGGAKSQRQEERRDQREASPLRQFGDRLQCRPRHVGRCCRRQ